jgi:hypothetical protein
MRATEFTQLSELNKSTLGKYVKANVQDRMDRATGDSFKSGQAGDAYNKADSGHRDQRREQGMDRAVNKLTKESLRPGEYYVHTVYLKNGDVRKFKDLGGESSIKDFYARQGLEVDHIDYDFSIGGGAPAPGPERHEPGGGGVGRDGPHSAAISRFDRKTPESRDDRDENPYGYEVGQSVELRNGKHGTVIDIFDDGIEVLLPSGRTITVDFQDANVLDETGTGETFCEVCGGSLAEAGKASRALCKSSRSNADLGVSQLASCKSQGLRARETPKKHTIGNKHQSIKGKMVKGHKYGGPLPYNKSDN